MDLDTVAQTLEDAGLILLGAFHPEPRDGLAEPGPATLILVGNAGPDMWRVFDAERMPEDKPDPLDAWTRRRLNGAANSLARTHGTLVRALFPFDGPPYLPFQAWAKRAGVVHASPFGPMIHPRYGLWHAYRGALAVDAELDLPGAAASPHPCTACQGKPCLSACPVGAFADTGYDVPACIGHLSGDAADDCFGRGCLARAACPVGRAYAYQPAQARFHMQRFFAAHAPKSA